MINNVEALAMGWPVNVPTAPEGDLETTAVLALIPRIREVADRAVTEARLVSSNSDLSPAGVARQQVRIGAAAVAEIENLAAAEAMRRAAGARMGSTPAPALSDVPAPLVAPLLSALANMEDLTRVQALRRWVQNGDFSAAVVAIHAPQPFDILTATDRAELTDLLRLHVHGAATDGAASLSQAIALLDRCAAVAINMVKAATRMADAPPPEAPTPQRARVDALAKVARGGEAGMDVLR